MKTLVVDTIKNRQWEFENLTTFEDERLMKIKSELGDELSHTFWNFKKGTITLFSEETSKKTSAINRAQLFKEKGVPSHIVLSVKFYNLPKTVYDSQLRRNYTDIGDGYQTIMVPLDHYQDVLDDLEKEDCKIIGEDYVWQPKETIQN